MRIAFHTDKLDVRGSCDALYNYAKYSEELYNHTSIILSPYKNIKNNELEGVIKFTKRFKVIYYTDLEQSLQDNKCDALYVIKYGKNDGVYSTKVHTLVHCVFTLEEPHGDVYIAVSKSLALKYNKNEYLPHMVGMKPILHSNSMRKRLQIPDNAIVIGRHGGMDTFNIDFVRKAISDIVRHRNDIYFLFMNTPKFDNHSHIIYLNKTSDTKEKELFINTCDLGLEASTLGHTFGLSCAEFSINNKPMLIYNGDVWNRAHIDIMGDKGLYFKDVNEFKKVIVTFDRNFYRDKDLNAYRDFNINKVMNIFNSYMTKTIFKETL